MTSSSAYFRVVLAAGLEPARPVKGYGFSYLPQLSLPPLLRRLGSGLSLHHDPKALGAARLVSTPSRCRAWLGIGIGALPEAFPEFGQFYRWRFRQGTQTA